MQIQCVDFDLVRGLRLSASRDCDRARVTVTSCCTGSKQNFGTLNRNYLVSRFSAWTLTQCRLVVVMIPEISVSRFSGKFVH